MSIACLPAVMMCCGFRSISWEISVPHRFHRGIEMAIRHLVELHCLARHWWVDTTLSYLSSSEISILLIPDYPLQLDQLHATITMTLKKKFNSIQITP